MCRDQRIVIFPANRNRKRFAKPTSVQMGIGIICEFQNLQIGIWTIFVRWEVFANSSQIPDIYFFPKKLKKKIFFLTPIFFHLKHLPVKQSDSEIYAFMLPKWDTTSKMLYSKLFCWLRLLRNIWKSLFVGKNEVPRSLNPDTSWP